MILLAYAGNIHFQRWNKPKTESTFGWDAGEYYAYLPALFIYQDIKTLHKTDSVRYHYNFLGGSIQNSSPDTIKVLNYSSGMAVLYTPAFAIAHILAKPLGYAADGFSQPYQLAVTIWCMIIAMLGLWHLRKLLLLYYSDIAVAITILIIAIGTNYLNYASADVILPHGSLFTVYVLLLIATIKFYKKPNYKAAMAIGALYGLAILIRPSEMVAALIPLLWGVDRISVTAIKKQFSFLLKNIKYLFLAGVCTIIVGAIQTIYWKYVTGDLFFYSYEFGFFWDGRFIYDFLFSWGFGWVMYNPMISFALLGLIIYLFKGKHKVAIILFALLNFYIISAWEIWYYSGLPGRAMIQSYAVLAFPLALFVETMLSFRIIKWVATALAATFLYFNIWLFHNAHLPPALFHPGAMTGAYFRAVIGRWNVSSQIEKLKDSNELFTGEPKNLQLIYAQNFESDSEPQSPVGGINSNNGLYIDNTMSYSPKYRFSHNKHDGAEYIRASIDATALIGEWDNWRMIRFTVQFVDKNEQMVKDNMMRINRFVNGPYISNVYLDTKIPEQDYQYIEVYFWNVGSNGKMLVDNLKVYSFEE